MKRVLKFILLAVPVIIVAFLIVVALQPSQYRVARTVTINASSEALFPHVNRLKNWEPWNPWGKLDPNMKLTYDGPESGVGASYSWVGNNDVGEGRMTITGMETNRLVRIKLEFFKPMAGVADTEFTFDPRGGQTAVTWAMSGENNFVAKAFCLFMNMDKMIGGQFEQGLAALKGVVEQPASGAQ